MRTDRWAFWTQRVLAVAGAFAALWAYAWLSDRQPSVLLLGFAVLALAVPVWLARDTVSSATAVQWRISQRYAPSLRGFDPRFSRLAQDLAESTDRAAVAVEVHAVLSRIADDILRSTYGVDPDREPETARRILGPLVADYLNSPPRYPRHGYDRQIGRLLERLESL